MINRNPTQSFEPAATLSNNTATRTRQPRPRRGQGPNPAESCCLAPPLHHTPCFLLLLPAASRVTHKQTNALDAQKVFVFVVSSRGVQNHKKTEANKPSFPFWTNGCSHARKKLDDDHTHTVSLIDTVFSLRCLRLHTLSRCPFACGLRLDRALSNLRAACLPRTSHTAGRKSCVHAYSC